MRLLATLLLFLVATGCDADRTVSTSRSPTGPTSASESATPRTAAPPAAVTPSSAGHLLRDLAPPPPLRVSGFCLNGATDRCSLPSKPRWSQYVEWEGAAYMPRDHDAGRDYVLIAVLAHANRGRAADMVRDVRRRSAQGRIDERVRDLGDGDYRYGRRGQGVVRQIRSAGWSGVGSVARVSLVRRGAAPVPGVVQVDTALRRGRFGVQVIGWLALRPGETDPALLLDTVTEQVLRSLDHPDPAAR